MLSNFTEEDNDLYLNSGTSKSKIHRGHNFDVIYTGFNEDYAVYISKDEKTYYKIFSVENVAKDFAHLLALVDLNGVTLEYAVEYYELNPIE